MAVQHCDGVRFGQPCRTLFAVGLLRCPHCGSTDYHEFGSDPGDEEHPMAKITPQGPSNTTAAVEPGDVGPQADDVAAEPEAPTVDEVPDGTIGEVLDWVGDDPERAQRAIDAEDAGKRRGTLIDKLDALVEAATAPDEPHVDAADEVEEPADSEPVDGD